jgi:hypothetical protein
VDEKLKKLDKLDSMESTLNGLATAQTAMQTSITGLQDDVTDLKTKGEVMENEILKCEARFCALERKCAHINKELKKERDINTVNEAFVKRSNLFFSGVPEVEDEKEGGCIGSIGRILTENLKIVPGSLIINACFRLGPITNITQVKGKAKKGNNAQRPRKIMVHLNTVADRNIIWGKKKLLKDNPVFISEDLPREMEKKRSLLVPIMKKARTIEAYKKSAFIVGDKLVINKVKYSVDKLDELPHDLNPVTTSTRTEGGLTCFYSKNSPFSNHFMGAPFYMGQDLYSCTEQRYFVAKAEYLGDENAVDSIMAAVEPYLILDAGKKITNRNKKDWSDEEVHAMTEANRHKYEQNAGVRSALLATAGTRLVECSPFDDHWGVGVSLDFFFIFYYFCLKYIM